MSTLAHPAGTIAAQHLFIRYHGQGDAPQDHVPISRGGEPGRYLADEDLVSAVRTAIALERPLLLTGEPGTGKTSLAWSVASELGLGDVLEFHTRSDHQARDVLYTFDHVLRFYHAQTQKAAAEDPNHYVTYQALGEAIRSPRRRVVLIDEIDKAPRDFPNDLLDEIDRMAFVVRETGAHYQAAFRPIVIITSNSEKQLPDAFLRRCVFHWIRFPEDGALHAILRERIPEGLSDSLIAAALHHFNVLRSLGEIREVDKPPTTDELVVWVRMLLLAGISAERLASTELSQLPHLGVLLKTRDDHRTIQKR